MGVETEVLRLFAAQVMRRGVPDEASDNEILDHMANHFRWLEEAWFDCHSQHTRIEISGNADPITDDAQVFVDGSVASRARGKPSSRSQGEPWCRRTMRF
jgi:hypothetical protein